MPKLDRLELSDNRLGGTVPDMLGQIADLYPNLRILKLSGNLIKSLDELRPLAKCEKLESVDVSKNPVS